MVQVYIWIRLVWEPINTMIAAVKAQMVVLLLKIARDNLIIYIELLF